MANTEQKFVQVIAAAFEHGIEDNGAHDSHDNIIGSLVKLHTCFYLLHMISMNVIYYSNLMCSVIMKYKVYVLNT